MPFLWPCLGRLLPPWNHQPPPALHAPAPGPTRHGDPALAAFEQGDWLAELELLQLGEALHRQALRRHGYDSESFDVMVTIADVLERDHGWDPDHADAWLERMGLWEQEL
ncbi:MAG: hypothetical protein ACO3FA_07895 [Vulcanococcus sp.]